MKTLCLALLLVGTPPERQLINITNKVVLLKQELSSAQLNLLNLRKTQVIIKYYEDAGTIKRWGLSPEYILMWVTYCEKYKYLAGKENNINLANFMLKTIHSETNGWVGNFKILEKDGTHSYGITNINDKCIKEIEKELNVLCPELKNKDIKTNVEKNIAGRFVWIHHRKERGKSWAYNEYGWELYSKLNRVK